MAFDDLDQAEQEDATDAAATDDTGGTQTTTSPAAAAEDDLSDGRPDAGEPGTGDEPREAATSKSGSPSEDDSPSGDTSPAFGFEEAKQRPLYARQEAWDAFEDALAIEVETTLRRNDVRDAPKRELHDAALRVLADHADEVAELVLEERGVD
ncbi:hypothetical protein [Halobaculum sp. EA56]|uniref:hypothetical protein n=1 Tax=Halobaculum sp. EA56 TaxID=3421648 RepID=UPI003EBBF6F8